MPHYKVTCQYKRALTDSSVESETRYYESEHEYSIADITDRFVRAEFIAVPHIYKLLSVATQPVSSDEYDSIQWWQKLKA